MRKKLFALLTVALLVLMVGCAMQTEPAPEPAPEPGPEPEPEPVPTEMVAGSPPGDITLGEQLQFQWELKGQEGKAITETAVYYGPVSEPGELGKDIAPEDTAYTSSKVSSQNTLPAAVSTSIIPMNEGTLYFRYHALVDGEHLWSDEYSVEVVPLPEPEPEPEPVVEGPEHTISVTESGFDPVSLTVKVGETVQWINERTKIQNGKTMLVRGPASKGHTDFKSPWFYNAETFEYTFGEEGKLVYVDAIYTTQSGTITVIP